MSIKIERPECDWSRGPCPRSPQNRGRGPRLQLSSAVVAGLMLGSFFSQAAEEAKDHFLFVGTDFDVVIKGHEHPVVDAGNRTFVFKDGNKRREKPLKELPNINIRRGLKLSNLSAEIDKVEAVLTSDGSNAEAANQMFDLMAMQTLADMSRDNAYGKMLDADVGRAGVGSTELRAANGDLIHGHNDKSIPFSEALQADAFNGMVIAERLHSQQSAILQDLTETAAAATANDGTEVEITPEINNGIASLSVSGEMPRPAKQEKKKEVTKSVIDAGNGRSDHLDINFQISSPTPLESAYVAITTEYTLPDSNEVFRRVLTERIGRVDSTPKKVSIYETGYREGFHLRTYFISVYANGQEVATNLSENKMTMTRDEAYEYIMVDYIASHRGQTLPPAAVLMAPRADLGKAAATPDLSRPVYVSVNAEGKVLRVSDDEDGRDIASPTVRAALTKFRFIPALDKGKPVAGRAELVVADFAR